MAEAALKREVLEITPGGIADFIMTDEEADEVYGPDEGGFEEYGDSGVAQFTKIANQMAEKGRGGDDLIAHVQTGELIIPKMFLEANPEWKKSVLKFLSDNGLDNPEEYIVGSNDNNINPETGVPEFGFFKKLKKTFKNVTKAVTKTVKKVVDVAKKVAPIVLPLVLSATPLGPIFGNAIGSGIASAINGGDFGDILKAAGIGAVGGAASAGARSFLSTGDFFGGISDAVSNPLGRLGDTFSNSFGGVGDDLNDLFQRFYPGDAEGGSPFAGRVLLPTPTTQAVPPGSTAYGDDWMGIDLSQPTSPAGTMPQVQTATSEALQARPTSISPTDYGPGDLGPTGTSISPTDYGPGDLGVNQPVAPPAPSVGAPMDLIPETGSSRIMVGGGVNDQLAPVNRAIEYDPLDQVPQNVPNVPNVPNPAENLGGRNFTAPKIPGFVDRVSNFFDNPSLSGAVEIFIPPNLNQEQVTAYLQSQGFEGKELFEQVTKYIAQNNPSLLERVAPAALLGAGAAYASGAFDDFFTAPPQEQLNLVPDETGIDIYNENPGAYDVGDLGPGGSPTGTPADGTPQGGSPNPDYDAPGTIASVNPVLPLGDLEQVSPNYSLPYVVPSKYNFDPNANFSPRGNPFRRSGGANPFGAYDPRMMYYYPPMRVAEGGPIYPRRNGGIMPDEGIPGRDSVRAMLMPGEFVMTTTAVRGAGNGDLNRGINNMYGIMRQLERRGSRMKG